MDKPLNSRKSMGPVSWLFQVITGVFLIFFLGIHLYLANIDFGHPIKFFTAVLLNMHNVSWLIFYIVFTWIILYHGLNGVKGILYDKFYGDKPRKYIKYSLIILYLITSIYGTALAISVSLIPVP